MCSDLQRDILKYPTLNSKIKFFEPKISIKASNNVTNLPFFQFKTQNKSILLKKSIWKFGKKPLCLHSKS